MKAISSLRRALFLCIPFFYTLTAHAGPEFLAKEFRQSAKVGQNYDVDCMGFLKTAGTGQLKFSLVRDPETQEAPPAWLTIDGTHLKGTPKKEDIGNTQFGLSVRSGDEGSVARIIFTVEAIPEWKHSPLDLGIQNERENFKIDLKDEVKNDAGGALEFSSPNLKTKAPWLELSKEGILSGIPKRENVGKYSDIVFVAKSIGGSSEVKAYGEVKMVPIPPKWIADKISLTPDALEDSRYEKAVSDFVLNPENFNLRYELVTGPAWGQVSATGRLFGTPKKADIGTNRFTIRFTSTDGAPYTQVATFELKVQHVNHAPSWKQNPIVLPPAYTKQLLNQNLSNSVVDPDDNETFNFQVVSGPAWARINSSGVLSGVPENAHVGPNEWEVRVTDSGGLSAVTRVQVQVIKSNEPPQWVKKPTLLPPAKEDFLYQQELLPHATDPDNDTLFFSLLRGPSWATLSESGVISGTPGRTDVGMNKFTVQVSDRKAGSDTAEVWIQVDPTNHAPQWVLDPVRIPADEDAQLNVSIAPYAKDIDGDKLTFTYLSGPTWAVLSTEGVFTGTPRLANVGPNEFSVQVSDPAGLKAIGRVIIDVRHVNHKPEWTANPVILPDAPEKQNYFQSLVSFVKDPDPSETLTFVKISGPNWLTVNAEGTVAGTPQRSDVGVNNFRVRVSDLAGETAVTTVQVTVKRLNTDPRWRQNPVLLTDGFEGTAYTFTLTDYAVDDDGDPLTFAMLQGPSWMKLSKEGKITGTPARPEVGDLTAEFEVSDPAGAKAKASARIKVHKVNQPPIVDPKLVTLEMKERETRVVDLKTYVKDPDGDPLNFTLTKGWENKWAQFTGDGKLALKPLHADLGSWDFEYRADDGQLPATGTVRVTVLRDPQDPIWLEIPVKMEAKTNVALTGTLKDKARDPDGELLKFAKVDGKAWLSVKDDGTLGGTPTDSDLGEQTFKVKACNETKCAENSLVITVKPGVAVETVQVDTPVPGARTENIWVIDHSNQCSNLIRNLKTSIRYYFAALKTAEIRHSGVLISADAHKWDGVPIFKDNEPALMTGDDPNIATDFGKRVDAAYSPASGSCSNCFNSPIWSTFRFFQRLPTIDEIYHKNFAESGVPWESLIVTQQRDHYKAYSKNTPQKNWAPNDYAKSFTDFATSEKKSLRVSAIAPGKLVTEIEGQAGPENAYQVIVQKTHGQYYTPNVCSFDVRPLLEDHAKRVIFRAYVHAKGKVRLTKSPLDAKTIRVFVGGLELPGNTGGATDKWTYDTQTNEIRLQWHLIDEGQLKPGDAIRIEYRVS